MKTIHYAGAVTIVDGEPTMQKGWKTRPLRPVKVSHLVPTEGDAGVQLEFAAVTGETAIVHTASRAARRVSATLPRVRERDDGDAFTRLVGEF